MLAQKDLERGILLIMTDDVGFGAPATFGGVIPTPTLDRIAANGLHYTNFHTISLCSLTRAALITGHNHHSKPLFIKYAPGDPCPASSDEGAVDKISAMYRFDDGYEKLRSANSELMAILLSAIFIRRKKLVFYFATPPARRHLREHDEAVCNFRVPAR